MHYYDILMCSRLMGLNLVKKTIINTITYLGVMLALSGAFLSLSQAQESGPEAVPSLYASQDLKQNQAPKIYTIYNISMDETARTSSLASQAALRKAQRLGLNKLFRKIIREEDYGKLPDLSDGQVTELVNGFEVANEKTSRVRYIADFTVHFSREKIYNFLSVLGMPFAETLSNPARLLTVVEIDGAVMLWESSNSWRTAWRDYDTINNLVPIEIIDSSKIHRMTVSPWQAQRGDPAMINRLAAEVRGRDLYVMSAKVSYDVLTGNRVLDLTVFKEGLATPAYVTQVSVAEEGPETLDKLYQEAIDRATYWLDNQWKEKVMIHFGEASQLTVRIDFSSPEDWFAIKRKLDGISLIRKVILQKFSTTGALARMEHSGDVEQIILTLEQENMALTPVASPARRTPSVPDTVADMKSLTMSSQGTEVDLPARLDYSWVLTLKK